MGSSGGNSGWFHPFLIKSPGTHFQAGWCGRPPLLQEKSNWDWLAAEPIPEQLGQFRPIAAVNINESRRGGEQSSIQKQQLLSPRSARVACLAGSAFWSCGDRRGWKLGVHGRGSDGRAWPPIVRCARS